MAISPIVDDFTVVDCDVHTMTSTAIQREVSHRLDEPYRSQLDPDNGTLTGTTPSAGFPVTVPGQWHGTVREITDPHEDIYVPLCEEFGVDYPLINMGTRDLDSIPESRRALQEMRAINDVLLDRFLDGHDELYGLATIATREPDKAAEEIDRMATEKKIAGLYVQLAWPDPALGDPSYDIMYRAAEDNGLSFAFHSGGGGGGKAHFQGLSRAVGNYLTLHTTAHPMDHILHLTSLIYGGVPVKFPDLNFVWLEGGLGWAAYLIGRMNRDYGERRFEAPLLENSPESYVRDSCYFSTQPVEEYDDPEKIFNVIDIIGADSIVFSTDYPHFDFDNPQTIVDILSKLDTEDRAKILGANAMQAFGIEA